MTAIAIVDRLADLHPGQFGKKQHSTVQRLLRALRKSAAQRLIAETAADGNENAGRLLGAVDGSGYGGPNPPTANYASSEVGYRYRLVLDPPLQRPRLGFSTTPRDDLSESN